MEDSFNSHGVPLIPPAYDPSRNPRKSDDSDVEPHDLPFLLPLSHSHPLLSSSNSSWDVDAFLLSRLHTPLDELRTDLRSYLAVLKEELVQLINEDYTEFISLGTGLRGEGKRLESVVGPLVELKGDVEVIRSSLVSNERAVEAKLEERATLRDEKTLLQLLLSLTDSLTRTETLLDIAPASSSNPSTSNPSSSSTKPAAASSFGALSTSGVEGGEKLVARVAAEYTRVLYLAEKARADGCAIVGEVEWRIERIRNTLNRDLDHLFSETLASLTGGPSNTAAQDKVRETLLECLKTYQLVEGWRDAEDLFRRELVRPFVRKIISADLLLSPLSPSIPQTPYLSLTANPLSPGVPQTPTPFTPSTTSNPFDSMTLAASTQPPPPPSSSAALLAYDHIKGDDSPLALVYNRLLREVESGECKIVLDVAEKLRRSGAGGGDREGEGGEGDVSGGEKQRFEFFGNVVWREIGERLMDELGSVIFAAGRPAELHQHYTLTHAFFTHLESMAPSLDSVLAMRDHQTYKTFEKRWQLPVYFQLRWKEIVTGLEEAMAGAEREKERNGGTEGVGKDGFHLLQTTAVFAAIQNCWAPGTFIPELAHRFWRLNLQILSRYRTWLESILPVPEAPASVAERIASASASAASTRPGAGPGPGAAASGRSTPVPEATTTDPAVIAAEDLKLKHATLVIADVKQLERRMLDLWNKEIEGIFASVDVPEEGLEAEAILTTSLSSLSSFIPSLSTQIISILTRRCSESFRLVRSVASQYRNVTTKREPKEASYFVAGILKPVRNYFAVGGGLGEVVKDDFGEVWSKEVFEAVAGSYASVLISVRKSDESLRKIRKSRKTPFSLFGGSSAGSKAASEEAKDEDNIKLQILLDVEGLRKDAESMGVTVKESKAWAELKAVVLGDGDSSAA